MELAFWKVTLYETATSDSSMGCLKATHYDSASRDSSRSILIDDNTVVQAGANTPPDYMGNQERGGFILPVWYGDMIVLMGDQLQVTALLSRSEYFLLTLPATSLQDCLARKIQAPQTSEPRISALTPFVMGPAAILCCTAGREASQMAEGKPPSTPSQKPSCSAFRRFCSATRRVVTSQESYSKSLIYITIIS